MIWGCCCSMIYFLGRNIRFVKPLSESDPGHQRTVKPWDLCCAEILSNGSKPLEWLVLIWPIQQWLLYSVFDVFCNQPRTDNNPEIAHPGGTLEVSSVGTCCQPYSAHPPPALLHCKLCHTALEWVCDTRRLYRMFHPAAAQCGYISPSIRWEKVNTFVVLDVGVDARGGFLVTVPV